MDKNGVDIMNCEYAERRMDLIDSYLNRELAPAEMERWEEHCFSCAACRQEFAFRSEVHSQVREHGAEIFADFIAAERRPQRRRFTAIWGWWQSLLPGPAPAWYGALAVALLLVASLFIFESAPDNSGSKPEHAPLAENNLAAPHTGHAAGADHGAEAQPDFAAQAAGDEAQPAAEPAGNAAAAQRGGADASLPRTERGAAKQQLITADMDMHTDSSVQQMFAMRAPQRSAASATAPAADDTQQVQTLNNNVALGSGSNPASTVQVEPRRLVRSDNIGQIRPLSPAALGAAESEQSSEEAQSAAAWNPLLQDSAPTMDGVHLKNAIGEIDSALPMDMSGAAAQQPLALSPAIQDTVNGTITFRWLPATLKPLALVLVDSTLKELRRYVPEGSALQVEAAADSIPPGRYTWQLVLENRTVTMGSFLLRYTQEAPRQAEPRRARSMPPQQDTGKRK